MPSRLAALFCLIGCALLAGCPPLPPTTQPTTRTAAPVDVPRLPAEPPDVPHRLGMARQTIRLGASDSEVRAFLGSPTLVQTNQWVFVADNPQGHAFAVITFDNARVTAVRSDWTPGWERLASAREHIPAGADEAQVLIELGQPLERHPGAWWLYAPEGYAPARLELFLVDDRLSWGSAYLLARLGRLQPGSPAELSAHDVTQLLGPPLAAEPGAQWDYLGKTGATEVHTTIFFKAGRVLNIAVAAVPAAP
jgi:hypothetical protein